MKKSILLVAVTLSSMMMVSCGPGEKEKKAASILCDCFDGVDMNDPFAKLSAAGCTMKIASDPELSKASERGTLKVMKETCPEAAEAYESMTK